MLREHVAVLFVFGIEDSFASRGVSEFGGDDAQTMLLNDHSFNVFDLERSTLKEMGQSIRDRGRRPV